MNESQIRALFAEIADGEPAAPPVDIQQLRRRGRARVRRRRAWVAGTSMLAAAAVVALAVGVGPLRQDSTPPAGGPVAPRQFSPLIPYLSFGWLPAGNQMVAGDTAPDVQSLVAGRKLFALSNWNLSVYAAGQCHLTGQPRVLKCSTPALEGLTARITGPAPAVRGHRAYWAGPYLVWQYARGGWAWLLLATSYSPHGSTVASREAGRRTAVKIASNVRYGAATPPLKFAVQLTGLPSLWRVGSVFYQPGAGVLQATRLALSTGNPDLGADGGLEYQTDLPWFSTIERAPAHGNFCGQARTETINGYQVVVTQRGDTQFLCAANADGLALNLGERGAHPPISLARLMGDHLRLLGANPANWTTKPIG